MYGRRAFISNATMTLGVPVLPDLRRIAGTPQPLLREPAPERFPLPAAATKAVTFKIVGWSDVGDDASGSEADRVWIKIGHSWRIAWQ